MLLILRLLGMFAVALAVGFGLSSYALTDGRLLGAARSGPWAAWPEVGGIDPDPYTRAYLSRTGILQLGLAEGVRFVASVDSAGAPLDAACRYRIYGQTPAAAFWTLEATDLAGRNIAASPDLSYLHSERIARGPGGVADIAVAADLAPGNWLEIAPEGGPFQLVLTLYDVVLFSGTGAGTLEMPTILGGGCA